VIAEMLGVPSDDQPQFVEWSDAALAMDGTGKPALPLVERTQSGYLSLANYFRDLVADCRRSSPRGRTDLLSTLVNAQDGNELSDHELVVTCLTILMGGFETTTSLIVNTLHLLLSNPDQRWAVQHDATMMAAAIEEGLRYESPIQIVMRRVNEPVELGPSRLVPGELAFAMVGAANRDPRHFPDPDRFDITRDARHVTFGAGIHFCIGAPLARMEAPIAIETILRRMPTIRFIEDRVHWNTAKPSARMPLHYNVEF
jgi:cytochrome P450